MPASHDRDDRSSHLIPLRSLSDQRLAPDEPDVRGWELLDAEGTPRGSVAELLVEPTTSEVAALAITSLGGAHEAYVVPMERVQIDERHHRVRTDLLPSQLAAMPRLTSATSPAQPVATPPAPTAARPTAQPPAQSPARPTAPSPTPQQQAHPGVTVERTTDGDEIVRVPIVEEELVIERRPVVKEVVVIRKRAIQEDRVVAADLRRERVDVDRSDVRE
jgi:hypothetical protein